MTKIKAKLIQRKSAHNPLQFLLSPFFKEKKGECMFDIQAQLVSLKLNFIVQQRAVFLAEKDTN